MKGDSYGSAEAPGAATIVNAMATGCGAAFAIDLKVRARVTLTSGGVIEGRLDQGAENSALMERCVEKVLRRAGLESGALVETQSNLPVARGLSSSSACSNACVLAASSAIQELGCEEIPDKELIELGIEASFDTGVTITGAFDDAAASFFGGAVVTDNVSREILRKEQMPVLEVILLVPEEKAYSGCVDLDRVKLLGPQVEIAHRQAAEGELFRAMTLNGLLYCASLGFDPSPAILALEAGAVAAGLSGKGPAFVALAEKGESVVDAWSGVGGRIIRTATNNAGAKVLE